MRITTLLAAAALPLMMGAQGDGCAASSRSAAPDVRGTWAIEYDNQLDVEVKLGGAVYRETLGPHGGRFAITHAGRPYTFDLDCDRADIVCPGEAWPNQVVIEQRDVMHQHQMVVDLPTAQCDAALTQPAPGTCGAGTSNPSCDLVCGGDITLHTNPAFGVIGEAGDSFRLYLGGGIVTNGINCAMLGYSVADATLVSHGQASGDWQATEMTAGLVTIGYAGGCLFAGPAPDGTTQALLAGAELKFTTGFTGERE